MLIIFFVFKPLDIKEKVFHDVPVFEFKHFTMYELDTKGLKTKMLGSKAAKYNDRYAVEDINYTDNSKKYRANMLAKKGIYRGDELYLDNNVTYHGMGKNRFVFHTNKALYNTKTSVVVSDSPYTITMDYGKIEGSFIKYNTVLNKIYSKNVRAVYQIN